MIENVWFYSSLPLISALCCLFLLRKLITNKKGLVYTLLFSNLALMNLTQSVGYLVLSMSISVGKYVADVYLITLYFFFAHLFLFVCYLSNDPIKPKHRRIIYLFPFLLTFLHINGWMVDGYRIEHNTPMHNDGPLAWCFDLYIITVSLATPALLWQNIKNNLGDRMLVSKNAITLISFIPLTIAFAIIILLSRTQYAIPVVIIIPTISIYTAITYYYISRDKVIDLSIGLSFFCERIKLAYLLLEIHKTKTDLKTFNKAVEKQFIQEALEEQNYNIQETADYLDINHTTLRNKIKEYSLLVPHLTSRKKFEHYVA